MQRKKSLEPFWWGLFSAGGVVAAFLVPVHVLLQGFAVPLAWVPGAPQLPHHWLVRLYLFILIALPLYHWAHRFYFTLNDMGLKPLRAPLALLCYGGAVAGSAIAAWILLRL
jgi:fumarate reductase subunit D